MDKKQLRRRPVPELTKEQKEIAKEIRDFLQRQKSQTSLSSNQSGGSSTNCKSSNNSPRKQRDTLGSALRGLPSTPKGSPTRKVNRATATMMMPIPYTSPYSARSHRSVPMIPTQSLASPNSVRSTRTVRHTRDSFARRQLLDTPTAPAPGGGYASDRTPRRKGDRTINATTTTTSAANTLQDEDAPCQKNYFSDADGSSASEDSCLFSDFFSENEDQDTGSDRSFPVSSSSSSSSSLHRKHRSSLTWNILTKGRAARRHHRLRASSPPNDTEDVTNLLGGSILRKHGG